MKAKANPYNLEWEEYTGSGIEAEKNNRSNIVAIYRT